MKYWIFIVFVSSVSNVFTQETEKWYISYYLPNYDTSQKEKGRRLQASDLNSNMATGLMDSTTYFEIYRDRGHICINRIKVDEECIEKYDGEQLYFKKNGAIVGSLVYQNGVVIASFGYLYYDNKKSKIPMIKYEERHGYIWNIKEYFLPNGQKYSSYGDFENGEGILNHLYEYRVEHPENFPIAYKYYLKDGKQRSKRVRE